MLVKLREDCNMSSGLFIPAGTICNANAGSKTGDFTYMHSLKTVNSSHDLGIVFPTMVTKLSPLELLALEAGE